MEYDYWTGSDYKIIQLILDVPTEYKAIWAFADDEKDAVHGPHHLEAREIEALGVVEVTQTTYRRAKDQGGRGVAVETSEYNSVVALELADGYWQVCNDCSNFAGIMREGQALGDCIGELDSTWRKLLPPEKEG